MTPVRHSQDAFYEYAGTGTIVCGECLDKDLDATLRGDFVGDERVYQGMFRRMQDDRVEAYQCDNCLYQNAAYEELGDEVD